MSFGGREMDLVNRTAYVYNRIGAILLPTEKHIESRYHPRGMQRMRARLTRSRLYTEIRSLCIEVFAEVRAVEHSLCSLWFERDEAYRNATLHRHFGKRFMVDAAYRAEVFARLYPGMPPSDVQDIAIKIPDNLTGLAAHLEAERACAPGPGLDTLLKQAAQFRREVIEFLNCVRLEQTPMPAELAMRAPDVLDDDGTFSALFCDHLSIIADAWLRRPITDELSVPTLSFGIPRFMHRHWIRRMYLAEAVSHLEASTLRPAHASNLSVRDVLNAVKALNLSRQHKEAPNGTMSSVSVAEALSENGRRAAIARHNSSPKAREKEAAFRHWLAWQAGSVRYKSVAEFARKVLDESEHLESSAVIEGWCRAWRKNAETDTQKIPSLHAG